MLNNLIKPQICFGGSGGGGGGGGNEMYGDGGLQGALNSRQRGGTHSKQRNENNNQNSTVSHGTYDGKSRASGGSYKNVVQSKPKPAPKKPQPRPQPKSLAPTTSLKPRYRKPVDQRGKSNVGANGRSLTPATDAARESARAQELDDRGGVGIDAEKYWEIAKAPEELDDSGGVGGSRDGGKRRRLKASEANEDNIKIKRDSKGVKPYKGSSLRIKRA